MNTLEQTTRIRRAQIQKRRIMLGFPPLGGGAAIRKTAAAVYARLKQKG